MKRYLVYYNFDIKDPQTDLIVEASKGTFTVEAKSKRDVDTDAIRAKISRIAHDYRSKSNYYVSYSNYYRLEEVEESENI